MLYAREDVKMCPISTFLFRYGQYTTQLVHKNLLTAG